MKPMSAIRNALGAPRRMFKRLEDAVPSHRFLIHGWAPPYERLDADLRDEALARGRGVTVAQPSTYGDAQGVEQQEPANLMFEGTLASLRAALRDQGWHPPRYPMSTMYMHGRPQALSLTKNENPARDHLRVFDLGPSTTPDRRRWAIAATRDLTITVNTPGNGHGLTFGHLIDHHIDDERDQVMHDVLAARPQVADTFQAVRGMQAHPNANYPTDGYLYQFSL